METSIIEQLALEKAALRGQLEQVQALAVAMAAMLADGKGIVRISKSDRNRAEKIDRLDYRELASGSIKVTIQERKES